MFRRRRLLHTYFLSLSIPIEFSRSLGPERFDFHKWHHHNLTFGTTCHFSPLRNPFNSYCILACLNIWDPINCNDINAACHLCFLFFPIDIKLKKTFATEKKHLDHFGVSPPAQCPLLELFCLRKTTILGSFCFWLNTQDFLIILLWNLLILISILYQRRLSG